MRTILIADEEEKIRHLVRFAFTEDMGYRVISASSGIDAAAMIKEFNPDVVICNVTLSGKDGYEISREIKKSKNPKDKYVILIAHPNSYSDIWAKKSNADEVILIPPDSINIIGEIGERLETLFKPRRVNFRSPLILIPVTIILLSALSFPFYESSLMNKISGYLHVRNQEGKAGDIVITISEKGEVSAELVDKREIQLEDLEPVLSDIIRRDNVNNSDKNVVLRVNSGVPYEFISQAMKIIKKTGVGKINLTTETSVPFDLSQVVTEHQDVDSQGQISEDDSIDNSTHANEDRSKRKTQSPDLTTNSKSGDGEKIESEKIEKIETGHVIKESLNIKVSYANIRSGPGMDYAIITRAQRGNTLQNLNQEYGSWIKVKTKDGVEGWIATNLVK
jgi:CheY-like chemotaxis protein/biopolymer transport protein ExbD